MIEGKVLVVQVNLWVIEVRVVVPVGFVNRVNRVAALVLILDPVVEEPVRDKSFALRFDDFASERAESFAARPNPSLRGRLLLAQTRVGHARTPCERGPRRCGMQHPHPEVRR